MAAATSEHPAGARGQRAAFLFTVRLAVFLAVLLAASCSALPAAFAASPAPATLPPAAFEECTIAVFSGRATADHRPMLWKNRDAAEVDNEIICVDDGGYRCLGLISSGVKSKIWMGVNEVGFAVLNSTAANLPDSCMTGIGNGELMREALQTCATVGDFELLLRQTNATGRASPCNLAVIDAQGGASLYEARNYSFVRYNAADSVQTPEGFVVRANLSMIGSWDGYDAWRYTRALALLEPAAAPPGAGLNDFLGAARDLTTAYVDPYPLPYDGTPPGYPYLPGYVDARGTINRHSTVAGGIIQGVLPGEDPRWSTFYAMVGQPVVTPLVPLWACAGPTPPEVDGPETSPLCDLAKARIQTCYCYPGNSSLLNSALLVSQPGQEAGYLTNVETIEATILPQVAAQLQIWRAIGATDDEVAYAEAGYAADIFSHYQGMVPSTVAWFSAPKIRCLPNPARRGLPVRIDLGSPASGCQAGRSAAVEIFDPLGRRVAALDAADPASASPRTLWWDGRTSGGAWAPAGIYYCRTSGPASALPAPLILIP